MNDNSTQIRLTEEGSLRRKKMLTVLQNELLLNSQRRRQKHVLLGLGAAMFLIASTIWIWNWGSDQSQNVVEQESTGSRQVDGQMEDPNPDSRVEFNQVSFETISDDELLRTLSNMGQPSVLGEIGGETKVISQLGPQRWAPIDKGS
jgi:hypothetical protein